MQRLGVSLRELLENPSLLDVSPLKGDYEKSKYIDEVNIDATLAFLGPNLWDTTFDGFLEDSNYSTDENNWSNLLTDSNNSDMIISDSTQLYQNNLNNQSEINNLSVINCVKTNEKEISKTGSSIINDLCDQNIPLKYIVGDDEFDPAQKRFKKEELVVAPILPKSQKVFVSNEDKDDIYWKRRQKNNNAARRSREARRMKTNKIAIRTAYLEEENEELKQELLLVKTLNTELKNRLAFYEKI